MYGMSLDISIDQFHRLRVHGHTAGTVNEGVCDDGLAVDAGESFRGIFRDDGFSGRHGGGERWFDLGGGIVVKSVNAAERDLARRRDSNVSRLDKMDVEWSIGD